MAENDEGERGERNGGDDSGEGRGKLSGLKDYLKLGATILVSLLLFAGFMRGCSACQKKNPITGEEIQQPPAPPPPPQAPPPQQ